MAAVGFSKTSNKNFILNVGMEKEHKQELGWRVSPAFHCILATHNHNTTVVECRNG